MAFVSSGPPFPDRPLAESRDSFTGSASMYASSLSLELHFVASRNSRARAPGCSERDVVHPVLSDCTMSKFASWSALLTEQFDGQHDDHM